MSKVKYRFNKKSLTFDRVHTTFRKRLMYFISHLSTGVVFAVAVMLLAYQFQAQCGCFDLFNDHWLLIGIDAIHPAAHFQGRVSAFHLVGDLHFRFIASGAGALHALVALRAELGAVAPLKPSRGQVTRLQNKFHQASDRDDMRFAYLNLRAIISVHFA